MIRSNLGRNDFISFGSSQSIMKEKKAETQAGQGPRGRNWSRDHGGGLLMVLLLTMCSACFLFFKETYLFLAYVSMYIFIYLLLFCIRCTCYVQSSHERAPDPWNWNNKWSWATMWILEVETRSSRRAASVNHWAISPSPQIAFFIHTSPTNHSGWAFPHINH